MGSTRWRGGADVDVGTRIFEINIRRSRPERGGTRRHPNFENDSA